MIFISTSLRFVLKGPIDTDMSMLTEVMTFLNRKEAITRIYVDLVHWLLIVAQKINEPCY